jgi:glycosyltransferase involved in cell wall biosynthesis
MPKSEQLAKLKGDFTAGGKVVYVGTVTPARGSMVTLQAFDVLSRKSMGVEFICIGPVSESHLAELEEYVSRKQLRDIRFVGRLRSSEALALASECSIGLATILPLPNYVESYPTKLFEYMALGLPVITSNFPLYREIVEVENCGICVDPEDPQEIADAIQRLIDDPELAIEMGKRGRAAALRSYRWDIEADKLLDFYRRVLSR